jgi:DNA repair protein RecO (recombination protein O)
MIQKTRGIVLRTLRYNDNSLIADVYTERCGRVSFIVTIPKSKRAGVKSLLLQPLALLEFDFDERPGRNLQRIKDVCPFLPFRSIPYEPAKTAVALFLAECLYHALRSEVINEPLFAYLAGSIALFDTCEEQYANFHLVFLTRLTSFLGIRPNVEAYHTGDWFDLVDGCFSGCQPQHAAFVKPAEAAHIAMLMRMNYETMHIFQLNGEQRMRCLEIINDYYRLHVPGFPVLKSLQVLREVFR